MNEKIKELLERIRKSVPEGMMPVPNLISAVSWLDLQIRSEKSYGGAYLRLSKDLAMADAAYWFLVLLDQEGYNMDQFLRNLERKIEKMEQAPVSPEISIPAPTVKNTSEEGADAKEQ